MRLRDVLLRQFARDDFFDLVLQAQCNMRDLGSRNSRMDLPLRVNGEQRLDFIVEMSSVAVVPLEQSEPFCQCCDFIL